ncbi:DNA-binding protein, partial [Salmonella enterica subsp. enterica serovar Typhimurium]|nr:DNA-binding protein [Salmonella enterica subsp. enterica serovar Typhimurium]
PEGVVRSYDRTRNVICTECRNSVTMQRVLAFYRGHHREAKSE